MSPEMTMHHVGIAVANLDQAIEVHQAIFDQRLLRGPYHDPLQHVSVCFMQHPAWGTGPEIELVAPASSKSPISSWLHKQIGAYHICYETGDLDAALAHVRKHHCVVLGTPVPAVAFSGRRVAWFFTPTRQLTELVER